MKKLITEEENEGLLSLLGQTITVMGAVYFYTGKLVGVDETCIKIENPKIIFETGPYTDKEWKNAESLNVKYWYVKLDMIESFGVLKQ